MPALALCPTAQQQPCQCVSSKGPHACCAVLPDLHPGLSTALGAVRQRTMWCAHLSGRTGCWLMPPDLRSLVPQSRPVLTQSRHGKPLQQQDSACAQLLAEVRCSAGRERCLEARQRPRSLSADACLQKRLNKLYACMRMHMPTHQAGPAADCCRQKEREKGSRCGSKCVARQLSKPRARAAATAAVLDDMLAACRCLQHAGFKTPRSLADNSRT